jgi:hypothetical protein
MEPWHVRSCFYSHISPHMPYCTHLNANWMTTWETEILLDTDAVTAICWVPYKLCTKIFHSKVRRNASSSLPKCKNGILLLLSSKYSWPKAHKWLWFTTVPSNKIWQSSKWTNMWQFSDWSMAIHCVIGPTKTAKASVMYQHCGTVTLFSEDVRGNGAWKINNVDTCRVVTNSMLQSSWEAVTQLVIMKPECSLHFSLILTQTNSVHKLTPYFLKTDLIILSSLFPSGFYSNIL